MPFFLMVSFLKPVDEEGLKNRIKSGLKISTKIYLHENLKQVQIDGGGKGFRLTMGINVFVMFVRNLVAKGLIVCANSTLFLAFCHTEFISVSRYDSCTLFVLVLSENLKQVQIDGGGKGFRYFVRNLVAKGHIICANSTLFLAFCHTEFISVSRHDSCTLFVAILSENLKQVQIDCGGKG